MQPANASSASPGADLTQRILHAFAGGEVKRHGASFFYLLGLLGVLASLVVITLIYVVMIAAASWLLWLHLSMNWSWIGHARGAKSLFVYGGGYVLVGVVCGALVLFLVKPLFAPPRRRATPLTLDPRSEPTLFTLIYCICDAVGAPRPVEVQVDCYVNAAAGLRRGLRSGAGDLSLTIGLPLVAGLTTRQLAGVLAHEFGHFGQGAGMRLGLLIRTINLWLTRAVHERDSLDEWLEDWAADEDWAYGLLGKMLKACVWLERLVLRGLVRLGGLMGGYMSQQMEYDADRYEARIAGSSTFAATSQRMRYLSVAHEVVEGEAQRLWRKGELPDNVPLMVFRREQGITDATRRKLDQYAESQHTAWWHTHPCDVDRVRAAEKIAASGLALPDDPAKALFRDFDDLARRVSMYWYEVEAGVDLDHVKLLETEQAQANSVQDHAREEAVEAFFGGYLPPDRILSVPMATPEHWQPAKNLTQEHQRQYVSEAQREQHLFMRRLRTSVGCVMMDAGFAPADLPGFFEIGLCENTARKEQLNIAQEHTVLSQKLRCYEEAAWTRIAAALAWKYNEVTTTGEWREHVQRLVPAQRCLVQALSVLREGWVAAKSSRGLRQAVVGTDEGPKDADVCSFLEEKAREQEKRVFEIMKQARDVLLTTSDPYATTADISLARSLWIEPLEGQLVTQECDKFEHAVNVCALRVSGDLCIYAYKVEEAWRAAKVQQLAHSLLVARQSSPTDVGNPAGVVA